VAGEITPIRAEQNSPLLVNRYGIEERYVAKHPMYLYPYTFSETVSGSNGATWTRCTVYLTRDYYDRDKVAGFGKFRHIFTLDHNDQKYPDK
jgi:hypothetical protein